MATHTHTEEDKSLLDRLDALAPIREFDAFPKVARTYYTNTTLGGFATILVVFLSFFLSLNDIGEFLWGWPEYQYSVDSRIKSTMNLNLDMVVNMPCAYLSIDVRDAIGDRLHLTQSFTRDGTMFDARQAHTLHAHGNRASTREIVTAAKKKSGGLFAALKSQSSSYQPTYSHYPSQDACRIYGSVEVKRVTGNLHITTLGHGYSSHEHTDHKLINLTHVITEFSFGPYYPNIVQPLDYTFEVADDPFTLFQYYLTVVPTVYRAPRSKPLRTNQYSATSYRRQIEHGRGAPGIFLKYDIDPMEMTVWQRTTSLPEFLLRLCGVIGGVWVCTGWAVKIGARAASVAGVAGEDDDGAIVNVLETAALRKKASQRLGPGGDLRPRSGNGWTIDGGAPTATGYSPYAASPTTGYGPGAYSGASTPVRTSSYSYPATSPPNVSAPTTPIGGPPPQGSYATTPYTNGRPQPGRHVSTGSQNEPFSSPSPMAGDSSPYAPSPSSGLSPYANGNGAATFRPKVPAAEKRID